MHKSVPSTDQKQSVNFSINPMNRLLHKTCITIKVQLMSENLRFVVKHLDWCSFKTLGLRRTSDRSAIQFMISYIHFLKAFSLQIHIFALWCSIRHIFKKNRVQSKYFGSILPSCSDPIIFHSNEATWGVTPNEALWRQFSIASDCARNLRHDVASYMIFQKSIVGPFAVFFAVCGKFGEPLVVTWSGSKVRSLSVATVTFRNKHRLSSPWYIFYKFVTMKMSYREVVREKQLFQTENSKNRNITLRISLCHFTLDGRCPRKPNDLTEDILTVPICTTTA